MNLKSKRILSSIMIAGDIIMVLIALALIFEEDLFLFGMFMLGFLAIDIYLTIDYIQSLKHREKVENSLRADNENARFINRNWEELTRQEAQAAAKRRTRTARRAPQQAPAPQPAKPVKQPTAQPAEEEDLSEVLRGPATPGSQQMHG